MSTDHTEALDALYRHLYPVARSIVRAPLDVDDIVQTTIERLWQVLQSGRLTSIPPSYAVTTLQHVVFSQLRSYQGTTLAGAGWFTDPYGPYQRYFDGRHWADTVRRSEGDDSWSDPLAGDRVGRRRPRRSQVQLDDVVDIAGRSEEQPEMLAIGNDAVTRLFEALPADRREEFYLHVEVGESLAEIGRSTGRPEGTMRTRHIANRSRMAATLAAERAECGQLPAASSAEGGSHG